LVASDDLSRFFVVTWSRHPDLIPVEVDCIVPEPPAPSMVGQHPLYLPESEIITPNKIRYNLEPPFKSSRFMTSLSPTSTSAKTRTQAVKTATQGPIRARARACTVRGRGSSTMSPAPRRSGKLGHRSRQEAAERPGARRRVTDRQPTSRVGDRPGLVHAAYTGHQGPSTPRAMCGHR
jgi:hypothetical protein